MLAGLYGCSSKKFVKLPDPCPETLILYDLSRQSINDPKTGEMQACLELDSIRPFCTYGEDQASFTPQPQFTAVRKDVKKLSRIKSNYFIALADPSGRIIEKQIFPLNFEFEKNKRTTHEKPGDTVSFSLRKSNIINYKIFVGLQIDDAEILKNRERYRKRP